MMKEFINYSTILSRRSQTDRDREIDYTINLAILFGLKMIEETNSLSFASLRNTDTTPTANFLYNRIRKVILNIAKWAVYYNLRILQEDGKYRSYDFTHI